MHRPLAQGVRSEDSGRGRLQQTARGCGNFVDVELFAEDGEDRERVPAGTRTGFHCVRFCVSYEQKEESRTVPWSS